MFLKKYSPGAILNALTTTTHKSPPTATRTLRLENPKTYPTTSLRPLLYLCKCLPVRATKHTIFLSFYVKRCRKQKVIESFIVNDANEGKSIRYIYGKRQIGMDKIRKAGKTGLFLSKKWWALCVQLSLSLVRFRDVSH